MRFVWEQLQQYEIDISIVIDIRKACSCVFLPVWLLSITQNNLSWWLKASFFFKDKELNKKMKTEYIDSWVRTLFD